VVLLIVVVLVVLLLPPLLLQGLALQLQVQLPEHRTQPKHAASQAALAP